MIFVDAIKIDFLFGIRRESETSLHCRELNLDTYVSEHEFDETRQKFRRLFRKVKTVSTATSRYSQKNLSTFDKNSYFWWGRTRQSIRVYDIKYQVKQIRRKNKASKSFRDIF